MPKSSIALGPHFGGSGGLRGQLLDQCWWLFEVLCWPPRRGAWIIGKPCFLMTVRHLLLFSEVPRGENQPKMDPETASSRNRVPRASREAPGSDFEPFGGHFGTHLGSKINKYRQKIDFEWFKELKNIEHALRWLPTFISFWFWSHFGAFWRWFLGWFWGVANTCTLT